MRLRSAVVILALASLAGCGGVPNAALPSATSRVATPASRDAVPGDNPVSLSTITEPSLLKGLSGRQVQALLGAPAFKRRDAPAEIWQYRARQCTLDLFVYEEGGGQRVEHYSVRSPARLADKDCFTELLAAAAAPGS